MTLRSGTSSMGREYRYYTCSTKARQGARPAVPASRSRWIEARHEAVVGASRIAPAGCGPARRDDGCSCWSGVMNGSTSAGCTSPSLERRATEAEAKLKRLYEAIENGVVDMGDSFAQGAHRGTDRDHAIRPKAMPSAPWGISSGSGRPSRPRACALLRWPPVSKLRRGDGTFARDHICARSRSASKW